MFKVITKYDEHMRHYSHPGIDNQYKLVLTLYIIRCLHVSETLLLRAFAKGSTRLTFLANKHGFLKVSIQRARICILTSEFEWSVSVYWVFNVGLNKVLTLIP